MVRASSVSAPGKTKKNNTPTYFTPNNICFNSFEKEALQIFKQVTENKNKILKKNSGETFYSKTTVKSRKFKEDGTEIVENFEATSYGGLTKEGQKIGEIVQRYFNKDSGAQKTSLQRIMGDQKRRIEMKRTLEMESTKEYRENIDSEFEREWRKGAAAIGVRRVVGFDKKFEKISPIKVT